MSDPALSLRGVSKRFGRTLALDGAELHVQPGTIHALLGENGAGKSTLMRIAFGELRADDGVVALAGTNREWSSSADAIAVGIGMVHQHFTLVPALTVAENVALGDRGFWGGYTPARAAERVRKIGTQTGLVLDPTARVADLSVGAQQRLEIVKALARNARVLILDEPTAVLSPRESAELYGWLREFVAGGGTGILITHKLREALTLADDVTVLRHGRTVLQSAVSEVTEASVVTALLGDARGPRVGSARRSPRGMRTDAPVVELRRVSMKDARGVLRLREATVAVCAGEILGVAGIEGAGQFDLLRILAGRRAPSSGTVTLPSRIGFVPEDRLRDAIVPTMSPAENVALHDARHFRGHMPWRELESEAVAIIAEYDVRPTDSATIGALSGGNQQKFVLGRELRGSPQLLVVENPTRGLDIRAAAFVLDRIRSAQDSGCAVIVYSSDLDELLTLAERMLVCHAGEVREVPVEMEAIGRAMVGIT